MRLKEQIAQQLFVLFLESREAPAHSSSNSLAERWESSRLIRYRRVQHKANIGNR
jgi:hypothetical protein